MKTAMEELIELIENGETRLDLIENHKQIWLEKEKKQMFGYVKHSYIIESKELEIHNQLFEQWYNQNYNK